MRFHCTVKLILLTSFSPVMYFFLFLKSTKYALFDIILPCISQEKNFQHSGHIPGLLPRSYFSQNTEEWKVFIKAN